MGTGHARAVHWTAHATSGPDLRPAAPPSAAAPHPVGTCSRGWTDPVSAVRGAGRRTDRFRGNASAGRGLPSSGRFSGHPTLRAVSVRLFPAGSGAPDGRVGSPAWTSADCSVCGSRGAVRYRGRQGRCQVCGLCLDRDHNGARNVYQRGAAQLVARGLTWTPAPLPIPPRWRRP
ncbi:zinc ribbon domain-containing protein [Deinococcus radiopugnans]|uniref:zinc ribbon domain-containing protein n=1 Tax=Deinococcus radiopugnans TaxID=57497 RepID=UPI0036178BF7